MKFITKLLLISFFFIILSSYGISSVEAVEAPPPRLKIGLALGGGGALGFANIGVLKWLEENQIPVDYVAGTSMGGLMGGCYAMGMSPAEIEQLVKSVNWDRLFDSGPPYNSLDFRRKEDSRDYPAELEIGLRDQIYIPNGLSIYQVNLLLSRITLPYSTIHNFDELPIPYRCVTTDIRNSEKVVLGEGSLAEAMRATMSVPGAFTPVERDGRVLVDGGLVDNVPADIAQKMGANVIIAVNCNESNIGKDLRRIDTLLMGSINTVLVDNTNRSLRLANIIIHPQAGNLSSLDWKAVDQLIASGYQSAALQDDELKKFKVDDEMWQEYLKERSKRKRLQSLIPAAIEIQGTNEINQAVITTRLHPFIGKPINTTALEAVLTDIMGSGFYESLRYEVVIQDQIPTLFIKAKEKSYGPPFGRFILQMDLVGDRTDINLRSRITAYNIIGAHSELRTDLSLGTDPSLSMELYKPITDSGWFLAPRLVLEQTLNSLFLDGIRENDFKINNSSIGLDLGYNLSKFSEARIGYQTGYQHSDTLVGTSLPEMDGPVRKTEFQWSYSKVNNEILDGGLCCDLRSNWYSDAPNASGSFSTAETSLKWLVQVNAKNSIFTILSAGVTTGGSPPLLQQFTLGGPFKLGAYNIDELRGDNYLLGTIGIIRDLGKPFGLNMYLATFFENGDTFENFSDIHYTKDLSVGFLSSTLFGPLYLGTSFGEANQCRISLLFGRFF
jgi:NTE family protein